LSSKKNGALLKLILGDHKWAATERFFDDNDRLLKLYRRTHRVKKAASGRGPTTLGSYLWRMFLGVYDL
jgi:hypothetical protein